MKKLKIVLAILVVLFVSQSVFAAYRPVSKADSSVRFDLEYCVDVLQNLAAESNDPVEFYKQMAMASGLDRIFESGPVFRAEKSFTNKHATEFTGFDLEFSYVTSCDDVMHMEEELLAYAFAKVAEKHGEKIKELFDKEVIVPTVPFPRMI